MATLLEVQKQAQDLSIEDQAGLIVHLLDRMSDAPSGPDDDEVLRRDEEMESGEVEPLTHEQFLAEFGRG